MIHFVIGHRGVGKSTFLKRIKQYFPEVLCFDLDLLIEKKIGQTVSEIIQKKGIEYFRDQESEMVQNLEAKSRSEDHDLWVAVGAGYEGTFSAESRVLHLRRETSKLGRIFLDRPRLLPEMRPLEEFLYLYAQRERRYQSLSDDVWTMPEGLGIETLSGHSNIYKEIEEDFFKRSFDFKNASLTLLAERFTEKLRFRNFIEKRKKWNFRFFELRNDLLSEESLSMALELLPREKLLLSARPNAKFQVMPLKNMSLDWDISLGDVPEIFTPKILSLHQRNEGQTFVELTKFLHQAKSRLKAPEQVHEKLSIEIRSAKELHLGLAWVRERPGMRSFLPRSASLNSKHSSLAWFRNLVSKENSLDFIREDEGSSIDQPLLFERLSFRDEFKYFGAIIGDPILQSFSPLRHIENFHKKGNNFFSISPASFGAPLLESDTLEVLETLGCDSIAVTSPYKAQAFSVSQTHSHQSQRFQIANTLLLGGKNHAKGALTDYKAAEGFFCENELDDGKCLVIGQGAMGKMIRELLPKSYFISLREWLAKDSWDFPAVNCLVWAAGSAAEIGKVPFFKAPLKKILDLNYAENSAAREWAAELKVPYVSGMSFFLKQAELQSQIWSLQDVTSQSLW